MNSSRPGPLLRLIFRAPVLLYERNLSWLLGQRFVCLTHIDRRSGRRYRTVLETIGTGPAAGEVIVIAGFGPSCDWYRNIQANPAIEVVVGRRRFEPAHRVLDEAEAMTVIAEYELRNRWAGPMIRRLLSRLLGWRYDGTDTARQRMVRQLPVVALRPRSVTS